MDQRWIVERFYSLLAVGDGPGAYWPLEDPDVDKTES